MSSLEIQAVIALREAEAYNKACELAGFNSTGMEVTEFSNRLKEASEAVSSWKTLNELCNDLNIKMLSFPERLAIGLKH